MKTNRTLAGWLVLLAFSIFNLQPSTAFAQGTAFTYQGRLNSGANPAGGIYDLRFTIYDAAGGGNAGGVLTNSAAAVTNGLFTVALDFGSGVFDGSARWLEIAVRTNGAGGFTTLAPRQPLTPAPYALYAPSAGNAANLTGTLPATQLTGMVPSAQLGGTYSGAVTLDNAGNSFTGNGAGLTNVNAAALNGLKATDIWTLGGNNVAAGQFLGSTNNQPVEIRVNGQRAIRLEPNSKGAPNVVGGAAVNSVEPGAVGATIGGGGATNYYGTAYTNRVAADFGTLSGGYGNTIQANASDATIGGGFLNTIQASAYDATIGGGYVNTIQVSATKATIGGGGNNAIQASTEAATIGGGSGNAIQTNVYYSTIGGGQYNTIRTNAAYSTVAGGGNNTVQANALYATIPGGIFNSATNYAFAAGRRARANHTGSFVWADSTDADMASTGNDEFAVRASGGVRFITGGAGVTLDGQPVLTNSQGSLTLSGTFSGNGAGLTNLDAANLTGSVSNLTLTGSLYLPRTTETDGIVYYSGVPFVHARGMGNFFAGYNAGSLTHVGSGYYNVGIGYLALQTNGTLGFEGNFNTACGAFAMVSNTMGSLNTAVGASTLRYNLNGSENVAVGNSALINNIRGMGNTASGTSALHSNTNGDHNTAVGNSALYNLTMGSNNVALGYNAGFNLNAGSSNIYIGHMGLAADNNLIRIGGLQAQTFIAGVITGNGGGLTNLNTAQFANSVLTNGATGVTLSGTFTGNGANVTNVNAAAVGGLGVTNLWHLDGNNVAAGQFLGSTNNQAVEVRVNNVRALRLEPMANDANHSNIVNFVGGSPVNYIAPGVYGSVIVGGGAAAFWSAGYSNYVSADFSFLGGGRGNSIQPNAWDSFLGGGGGNSIQPNAEYSFLGGGYKNSIQPNAQYSFLGGGRSNTVSGAGGFVGGGGYDGSSVNGNTASGVGSVVVGGMQNVASGSRSIVGGGAGNTASGAGAVIGGGGYDGSSVNGNTASGVGSVVVGGTQNIASGSRSTIGGGHNNSAANFYAAVPGGAWNLAGGVGSFAAGQAAKALHDGAFVWSDSSSDVASTNANSVTMRASGGYRLFSKSDMTAGVYLAANGTSWSTISDRNAKKNFAAVGGEEVLNKLAGIPIQRWNYKWEADDATPNLGPMAQDFKAAFYPGRDDKSITTLEYDGVELAAIQGLNQKLNEKDAEIQAQARQIENLVRRLETLEQRLAK